MTIFTNFLGEKIEVELTAKQTAVCDAIQGRNKGWFTSISGTATVKLSAKNAKAHTVVKTSKVLGIKHCQYVAETSPQIRAKARMLKVMAELSHDQQVEVMASRNKSALTTAVKTALTVRKNKFRTESLPCVSYNAKSGKMSIASQNFTSKRSSSLTLDGKTTITIDGKVVELTKQHIADLMSPKAGIKFMEKGKPSIPMFSYEVENLIEINGKEI